MLHAKFVAYPLKHPISQGKKIISRKSKELWTKGPKWNNTAYEEKEKVNRGKNKRKVKRKQIN